jgi:hypothetical protein
MKLLTIATDPSQLDPLTTRLHQLGIAVSELSDVSQIDVVIASERPDLVLVNGEILCCQVLVALRTERTAKDLQIACLIAQEDADLHAYLLATGVVALISTLNGVEAMVEEVRQLCSPQVPVVESCWLVGGGEMGKFLRAKDWSQSPLGAIENWPASLRTTVSLVLNSNFPISLAWGEHHTQIYNDGYRSKWSDNAALKLYAIYL